MKMGAIRSSFDESLPVNRHYANIRRSKADMPITTSDRVTAATLVLLLLAAQTWWMGRPVIFLSGGLIIAYGIWAFARWNNDATTVLPVYLLAIAVQCLHFTEEYLTDFQRQFPKLMGGEWSDAHFVTFNMVWLAVFVLAGLGVHRQARVAYVFVIFLALIGGVGNGASHLFLSAVYRRYFPGAGTAIFCLGVGIALLLRLFRRMRDSRSQ